MKENDSKNSYTNLLNNLYSILKDKSNKESSYATFYQSKSITVGLNEFFPFDTTASSNDDIVLLNSTDIHVKKSGIYHIIYKIPILNENKKGEVEQSLGLYVNGILRKNIQRTFAVVDTSNKKYMYIIEDLIIYIPDNSILQLKNNGFFTASKAIYTFIKENILSTFSIVKIG